jgi:glutamate synthase (ferredoxin)
LLSSFVKVIPKDYQRMIRAIAQVEQEQGLSGYEAALVAFETVIGQSSSGKEKKKVVSAS